jgi:hypothetical protein
MRGPKPRFKPGDKVKDFRGNKAMVVAVVESAEWQNKSHRVRVQWADRIEQHKDRVEYYEEVFDFDA